MVLDTRDIEDSSTMTGFPISIHKKVAHFFKYLVRISNKKIYFLFWLYEGVVGEGGGQTHVNIVLGWIHNSSDALN